MLSPDLFCLVFDCRYIHPYQQTFIEAVAFGTDLEKLEVGNYEDCKRLLYLPKSVKK